MQYRRCKCGARERWDSGEVVKPCEGCDKCGTTFAQSPSDHRELEPHDWKPLFDPMTGEPTRRICRQCHAMEKVEAPC